MSIEWRMGIYDNTFTAKDQPGNIGIPGTPLYYLKYNNPVAALQSFDIDGAGNCLEANFSAVPSQVDVVTRDIIDLEISEDGGSTYEKVYRGYITIAGNPRSTSIESFRAVGLKQQFYETMVETSRVVGADVATMVNDVFDDLVTDSLLPAGVTTTGEDIPTLGFAVGDRYPQFESAGELFDALAETVGSFVVPSGQTYTYDGVTYEAGETVPAVEWGVRPDGQFFFARPQAAPVVVSETDPDVFVDYKQISGEKVIDDVRLIYLTQMEAGPFDLSYNGSFAGLSGVLSPNDVIVQPLSRLISFGSGKATMKHTVFDPRALMTNQAQSITTSGCSMWSNINNAIDDDDATYGEFLVSSPCGATIFHNIALPTDGFLIRIKIENVDTSDLSLGVTATDWEWTTTVPAGEQLTAVLPVLQVAGESGLDNYWELSFAGANVRLYSAQTFFPDIDDGGTLSEEYANGFVRAALENVASVTRYGAVGSRSQDMLFTPEGESSITVPIKRIDYALTTREGLVTTYHLEQAYDADLVSERAVLEALAARSAR